MCNWPCKCHASLKQKRQIIQKVTLNHLHMATSIWSDFYTWKYKMHFGRLFSQSHVNHSILFTASDYFLLLFLYISHNFQFYCHINDFHLVMSKWHFRFILFPRIWFMHLTKMLNILVRWTEQLFFINNEKWASRWDLSVIVLCETVTLKSITIVTEEMPPTSLPFPYSPPRRHLDSRPFHWDVIP